MATIKGFQLKNVKQIIGREGYGCSASMYLNGKKIGTYIDYGDGGCEEVNYTSKEAEQEMTKIIIAYAKEHPNHYIIDIYNNRPQQYKEESERFKKNHPYIPDEDITIQTMASNSIVYIVEDILTMLDYEKAFKQAIKKGYGSIGVKGNKIYSIPVEYPIEKIKLLELDKIYTSINDFCM